MSRPVLTGLSTQSPPPGSVVSRADTVVSLVNMGERGPGGRGGTGAHGQDGGGGERTAGSRDGRSGAHGGTRAHRGSSRDRGAPGSTERPARTGAAGLHGAHRARTPLPAAAPGVPGSGALRDARHPLGAPGRTGQSPPGPARSGAAAAALPGAEPGVEPSALERVPGSAVGAGGGTEPFAPTAASIHRFPGASLLTKPLPHTARSRSGGRGLRGTRWPRAGGVRGSLGPCCGRPGVRGGVRDFPKRQPPPEPPPAPPARSPP